MALPKGTHISYDGTVTPPASKSPQGGTESPYYPRYTEAPSVIAPPPQSTSQLQAQKMQAAQAEIDALNKYYASQRADQMQVNEKNDRSTAAISTLTGLAGSTDADAKQQKTSQQGQQALKKVDQELNVAVQSILSKIRQDAATEARQQRLDYNQSVTDDITNRANQAEMQSKARAAAGESIKQLTAAGVTAAGLKKSDPTSYQYLLKAYGSDEAIKGAFVLNTPQDQILDKRIEGGRYVIARQNPITGKVTIDTHDLGLPVGFSKTVDAGDRILAIPDDWDGDPSKLVSISKGLTPDQKADNAGGGAGGLLPTGEYGTPEYTLSTIKDSSRYGKKRLLEGEVKNITAAKRALGSLELVKQAMNGTLDKSVSQEVFGEGTGVIKGRIRTLASAWGGDPNAAAINAIIQGIIPTVARGIFQEVGVLTDQDIANYKRTVPDINKPENANKLIELVLLKTLERAYADTLLTAAQNQTNVSNFAPEYESIVKRIGSLAGSSSGPKTLVKDGQSFDASALSPEEYQQALKDGYVAQ